MFSKLAGSGWGGITAAAVTLLAAGGIWKIASFEFNKFIRSWASTVGKKRVGDIISPQVTSAKGDVIGKTGGAIDTVTKGSKGMGMLKAGAGIGAATLGTGAGIGIAAAGISKLADSMSKLDDKKAQILIVL